MLQQYAKYTKWVNLELKKAKIFEITREIIEIKSVASKLIDNEITAIVSKAESNALTILNKYISQLHDISNVTRIIV